MLSFYDRGQHSGIVINNHGLGGRCSGLVVERFGGKRLAGTLPTRSFHKTAMAPLFLSPVGRVDKIEIAAAAYNLFQSFSETTAGCGRVDACHLECGGKFSIQLSSHD